MESRKYLMRLSSCQIHQWKVTGVEKCCPIRQKIVAGTVKRMKPMIVESNRDKIMFI